MADAPALTITPDVVSAGDEVEVTADDQAAEFGAAWRLERDSTRGWTREYTLVAASAVSDATSFSSGSRPPIPDAQVTSPVTLVIPAGASPGEYRICQTVGTADVCGRLTVRA